MKIGYARVSTEDQSLDLQLDALNQVGCGMVFQEKASGAKEDRKQLAEMLKILRKGDTVIVWKLDRLGRSLKHLIKLTNDFRDKGIHFKSIKDSIDTNTPTGRMMFGMLAVLAEFERDLASERTKAGLKAARARGRKGGRPKGIAEPKKAKIVAAMYKSRDSSITEICETVNISKTTLYRYLRHEGVQLN